MTRPPIEQLKKLLEKATEGPWAYEFTGEKSNDWCLGQVCNAAGELKDGEFEEGDDVVTLVAMCDDGRLSDARFICAARNQLPSLIAYTEQLEKALGQASVRLNEVQRQIDHTGSCRHIPDYELNEVSDEA